MTTQRIGLCWPRGTVVILLLLVLPLVACLEGPAGGAAPAAGAGPPGDATPAGDTAPPCPTPPVGDEDTPVCGPAGGSDTPEPGPAPTLALMQGRVTTVDGQPLAGVLVTPQSTADPPAPLPEIAIWTDAQGAYWWSLPPGPYTLTFTRAGYQPRSAVVVLQPGQALDLDVTLEHP